MTNQVAKKPTKDGLKVMALIERIGQLTSRYEDELADIRATATQQIEQMGDIINEQEQTINSLQAQLQGYQDASIQEENSADTGADSEATADNSNED